MDNLEENEVEISVNGRNRKKYDIYVYRYIALLAFNIIICCDSILLAFMFPIFATLGKLYDLNMETWMDINALTGLLTIPSLIVAVPLIEKRGVHISMGIGAVGVCLSARAMTALNISIYFLLVNYVLYNIFTVFYRVAITKVSVRWFPPSQRVIATFITNIMNDLSIFLGSYIPTWYVSTPPITEHWSSETIKSIKQDMQNGLLMEAILSTGMFIIGVVIYRERPKNPPSPAEDLQSVRSKSKIIEGLLYLVKNKNFMILFIGHVLFVNMIEMQGTNQSLLYVPFDINTELATAYSTMARVISGSISASVVGFILNKYKRYKLTICVCAFTVTLTAIMNTFLPYSGNLYWIMVGAGISAFAYTPELSTVYEFSCELGYPVGESTILGAMFSLGSIFAVITQFAMKPFVQNPSTTKSAIFGFIVSGVILSYGVSIIFIREDLRRDRRDTSIMEGRSQTHQILPFDLEIIHDEFPQFQLTPLSPMLNSEHIYSAP